MSSVKPQAKTDNSHPPRPAKSVRRRGLLDMVAACLLFSIMNASVYAISVANPGLPAVTVSFIRVACNLFVLIGPAMLQGNLLGLFGDFRYSLWLRGLFGASALMLSFAAITRIGPGESSFLTACNGVFIALLSPLLLGQRHTLLGWLAIIGSLSGVSLLFLPDGVGHADLIGRTMALGSGFLMALAYLMVARAGRSNTPASVIFYFCLVALFLHAGYFALFGFILPDLEKTWGLLIFTGLSGSAAQHFMTRAYQAAPAALVGAVGYMTPVFSLGWGILMFSQFPSLTALIGSLLIVLFGVCLPFIK